MKTATSDQLAGFAISVYFLQQSAIATGETLEWIERELAATGESRITVVWGKTFQMERLL